MKILNIESLREGIPFITEGWFCLYREKCAVAFSSQGHSSGVKMNIRVDGTNEAVTVLWDCEITQQLLDSHADSNKTTDDAACAIALLIIREFTEYTAYKTTDTNGERVDYYLTPKGEAQDDMLIFNNTSYLEVSGIRKQKGNNTVANRLNEKTKRAESSTIDTSSSDVYICIVEFGQPFSVSEEVSCLLM